MKNYYVRFVGNDGFDRAYPITATSMAEAVKLLPSLEETVGRFTIEQFVRVEVYEAAIDLDI